MDNINIIKNKLYLMLFSRNFFIRDNNLIQQQSLLALMKSILSSLDTEDLEYFIDSLHKNLYNTIL